MKGAISLLLCAAVVTWAGPAGAELLASWADPVGDDTGDGDYTYPTNPAFGDLGEADLLEFAIEKTNGNLVFVFRLRNLVDPWGVGNRLTMVAVAIDTQEGGDEELRRNANVFLEAPSEYQVFAAGEAVQVVDENSEPADVAAFVTTDVSAGTIRISVL